MNRTDNTGFKFKEHLLETVEPHDVVSVSCCCRSEAFTEFFLKKDNRGNWAFFTFIVNVSYHAILPPYLWESRIQTRGTFEWFTVGVDPPFIFMLIRTWDFTLSFTHYNDLFIL